MAKLTDDEIRAITDAEIRQSMGFMGGKLSEARRKNEYYYLGQPIGDLAPPQVDGRSSVVSTDVADTVNWMLPSLLKIFTAGDNAVEFTPQKPEDEQAAKQATDYINYIFYKQNPGFNLLHTWFKDSLIQKVGVLKVFWDVSDEEVREEYKGLSELELTQLLEPVNIEPLEHSAYPDQFAAQQMHEQYVQAMQQYQMAAQQAMQQGQQPPPSPPEPSVPPMLHDIAIKRTEKKGKVCIEAVPPEEFMISRRAKCIEDSPFVGHRIERTLSDLKASGYKNVENITSDDQGDSASGEAVTRKSYDDDMAATEEDSLDPSQRVVWLTECYMKLDVDGDGIAEWRKIVRAGNEILENEECDGPPFVSITPVPLPHRFFGQCPADQAVEPQRIKTSLLRAIMDNLYMGVNGRYYAVENQVNLDDLLTSRPGGVVRVKQVGAVGRLDAGMGDNQGAYQMLEHLEVMKENRTGYTRYSQGTNADALNQTLGGMNIITNRSDSRVELIARVFAETGVKDLFLLILKLISQNQDKQAVMRLNNEWVDIDPSQWKTQFDFTVNVGLGTGNKDQMIQHLVALKSAQMEGLPMGISTPANVYNANKKLSEFLGFKDADSFFTDPSKPPKPGQEPPPKPPDPKLLEMKDKQQRGIAEMELQRKKHDDEMAYKYEALERDTALKRQELTMRFQMERESAMYASLKQQSESGHGVGSGSNAGQSGAGADGAPVDGGGIDPNALQNNGAMEQQPGPGF